MKLGMGYFLIKDYLCTKYEEIWREWVNILSFFDDLKWNDPHLNDEHNSD